jgi:hypothetical protein
VNKAYKGILDEINELLEDSAGIKAPVEDYIDFLEEISSSIEMSLIAANEDLERMNAEDE